MAGRDIKGISVEIGGDTTKLQSALQGVNKDIKNTQTQLKDVEKLLKLDPSNTELLSQKQKLLAQAISETKEKLATLKTAAEQANEQLAKGEITQEQYDALQREIEETEQALRELESQASTTNATLNKIEEVGGKFQQVGETIAGAGKTLTKTVTAPILALGTAAVKTAADFDEGMSKVSAISGATGDDLDALRGKAREMGAKTKFSATEAASAFEYMAMAGWKTGDINNNAYKVKNAASSLASSVKNTLGFSIPKEGPLSDADTYMPDFMDLMAKGIRSSKKVLLSSIRELAETMSGAFTGLGLPELQTGQLALAGAGATTNNRTVNVGGINVTVNGYNATNDDDLADTVVHRINEMLNEDGSVWGR